MVYNTQWFIKRSKLKHSDKYDYSLVEYVKSRVKVKIICPDHGVFEQEPASHIKGNKCPICSHKSVNNKRVEHARLKFNTVSCEKHSDKYDYSLVEYVNNRTNVKIICPDHGVFEQQPDSHLRGRGCPECANRNVTTDKFIQKAKLKQGDKYDYSLVEYVNNRTNVKIICPDHGVFEQTPNNHLSGSGCLGCVNEYRVFNFAYNPHSVHYKPDDKCYVYLFELNNNNELFSKIGVTKDMNERCTQIENETGYKVTLLDHIATKVKYAMSIEHIYHKTNKDFKYKPLIKFSGFTECFTTEAKLTKGNASASSYDE